MAPAVGGDDRVGFDAFDVVADQLDVVTGQRPEPAAVVLEGAFPGGRIVGNHLGQQLGVVADLALDPVGEHGASRVVHLADGPSVLMGVRGVDASDRHAAVARRPEDQEAVPPAVEGQVAHGPAHAVADRLVIVGVGEHPLGRALEHRQVRRVRRDGRHDLEAAGPGADDRHPLARVVDGVVPLRRMERGACERVTPRDVGKLRSIELSDRGDHGAGLAGLGRAVGGACLDRPRGAVLVPGGADHLGLPSDVRCQLVALHHPPEVGLQLRLPGEELAPVVGRLERVAVEVIADVDPGARVRVLVPGAARRGVLLDDRERDAGLAQPDTGQEARHAGADHDDREGGPVLGREVVEVDPAGVEAVQLELFQHHRHVFGADLLADEEVHHLLHQLGVRIGREHAPTVAVGPNRVQRLRPHRGLVLLGHEPLDLVEEHARGAEVAADPRRVAGQVHHRHHQRRDADVLQGRRDGGVVVGDDLACVGIAFVHGLEIRTSPWQPTCSARS